MEPRGTLGPMRYQPEEAADTPRWGLPRAVIVMLGMAGAVIVVAGTAAFATLLTELLPLAADRRTHPGDDLLSFIAADWDLELDDVVITAVIIAIVGRETTANLLGVPLVTERIWSLRVGAAGPRSDRDDRDPVLYRG